ncbi:MAG: plasma-membrane proton-efflux P-type ATPase [Candidatus Micrarchaeia archaeon]
MASVNDFENMALGDAFAALKSSAGGLSEEEAARRLEKYGYNEIIEKKHSGIARFAKKFYGPIPFILEAVLVITFLLHDAKDFYIILALLIFNALVSFFEESKADNSVELLKKRLSVSARVLRSGAWRVVAARQLVPGDIIRIRIGDIVPADAKVIESSELELDQSVLTGESLPVKKNSGSIVYSGSVVREGEATCVVAATGYSTYYGKTTQLLQTAGVKSHLESLILKIVRYLVSFDTVIVLAILLFGLLVLKESYAVMVPFVLVVLIASVPVALPAAFTVTMALGTKRLADKSVLVTKLESIEETSTLNVVCFDKTGTLTKNKMSVKEVFALPGHSKEEVLKTALLASRKEDNDPIDNAVIDYANAAGVSTAGYMLRKFFPFRPKTKMSSAELLHNGKKFIAMKGAYSAIGKISELSAREKPLVENQIAEFSKYAYRTIAIAGGEKPKMMGVIALYDEPRPDAGRLIKELESLGVDAKMLTGDNLRVAQEIAKEVGISRSIVDFSSLKGMNQSDMERAIKESGGFAEIFPEDKYTVVKALQKEKLRVGMTGDGVNDAPAIKQAEVGIAVENATDVAKSAAGIVLAKNGLDVIVDAVKESRRIFERMMTYAMLKIVKVIQIVLFVAIAFMLLRQVPILPFELILLIFTNDIVNITLSTDNAEYSLKPDTWNMKSIATTSLALGFVSLLLTLAFLPIGMSIEHTIGALQTFFFFMFVVTDNFMLYSLRNRRHIWDTRPSKWLVASSVLGISVGAAFAYFGLLITPISAFSLLVIICASFLFMLAFDYAKLGIHELVGIRRHYKTAPQAQPV